jgi:hypothetical protein
MTPEHAHDALECRKIFERLSEYVDEEVDPGFCGKLETHLEDCEPCVAFLESLRRTIRWIEQTEPATAPDVRREVREALERLRREKG